jgi:hypothetical protein
MPRDAHLSSQAIDLQIYWQAGWRYDAEFDIGLALYYFEARFDYCL